MFNERYAPKTKADIFVEPQNVSPRVAISSDALIKMFIYVDECNDEIGWLGTAKIMEGNEHNIVFIDDVFLFDQEVHATTTEITPEGLTEFANELIEMGDKGIEIWNNIKVWGHSHVNMGVSPSGQDDEQMKTFRDGGHDWFIRIIANKKGELKVDFYDYTTGIAYLDVAWFEVKPKEEEEIKKQIEMLEAQLENMQIQRYESALAPIQEEMKAKVRKKTYTYTSKNNSGYSSMYQDKKNHNAKEYSNYYYDDYYYQGTIQYGDYFKTDEEVKNEFGEGDLLTFAHFKDTKELNEELELWGYYMYFTEADLERILRVSQELLEKESMKEDE